MNALKSFRALGIAALTIAAVSSIADAQNTTSSRSDVELPLSTYDALRAAAKERKEPPPKPARFTSARLVKGTMRVDLDKRRAFWEAEIEVEAGGDEPLAIPLIADASPLSRSSAHPETARLESKPDGTRLLTDGAGTFRVSLAGEESGQGEDESLGIRFPLPRLLTAPAAFDLFVPEGAAFASEGGAAFAVKTAKGLAPRVTWRLDQRAVLVVKRASRTVEGPPVVTGSLHFIERISDDARRAEARLLLHVKSGLLSSKTLRVPGFSLVSASGPVIASGPDADGTLTLRFEPPVRERGDVAVTLALLASRDAKSTSLEPTLPVLSVGGDDRLERFLTVVAEGGLLVEPERDDDWTARTDLSDVRAGSDDVVLGWRARVEAPRPPRLTVRRLRSLAVASALARVRLDVFVGVSGETRMRLVADVRSRGRSSLKFRVPADATLLAVRSDGEPAVASRPSPERVEVPIGGDGGRARVELLLSRASAPPKAGEKMTIAAAAPEEPVERVSWSLVLPPGLSVKEEGRRVPAPPEPPGPSDSTVVTAADRAAFELARQLAGADREAGREAAWSPRAALPAAPLAYATDLVDVGETVPPLVVTLVAAKEDSSWY